MLAVAGCEWHRPGLVVLVPAITARQRNIFAIVEVGEIGPREVSGYRCLFPVDGGIRTRARSWMLGSRVSHPVEKTNDDGYHNRSAEDDFAKSRCAAALNSCRHSWLSLQR